MRGWRTEWAERPLEDTGRPELSFCEAQKKGKREIGSQRKHLKDAWPSSWASEGLLLRHQEMTEVDWAATDPRLMCSSYYCHRSQHKHPNSWLAKPETQRVPRDRFLFLFLVLFCVFSASRQQNIHTGKRDGSVSRCPACMLAEPRWGSVRSDSSYFLFRNAGAWSSCDCQSIHFKEASTSKLALSNKYFAGQVDKDSGHLLQWDGTFRDLGWFQ